MTAGVADPDIDIIKKSIVEIRKLSKELTSLKARQNEAIAVVGVGCEFPGDATTPEDFWALLCSDNDAMSAPPKDRWDITNKFDINYDDDSFNGGFLSRDISKFDSIFFDIPPKEAKYLDPQHRLFLEVTWNALKSANLSPESLSGSKTGLFCGITGLEYLSLMLSDLPQDELSGYITSGNCLNFIAGRLSYILGLQGPSIAIDTACSSSLVALHYACKSLRNGECDMAISGGVNLILSPQLSLLLKNGNMLSSDGKCKTFDDSADGYARGEGCGVVVLKRLSDAIENNDKILATIKNTHVNHDGKKSGLTVPRSESQKKLMLEAIHGTDLETTDIVYAEAHGTGTSLGDPIELEGLKAVYGKGRQANDPLLIGSAKSKIGHLESAAGIAGFIKIVLSVYKRKLPPHLNCVVPNHHFDWDNGGLKVVQKEMDWPQGKKRVATVSSFGASGTNAHAIVEGYDTENISEDDNQRLLGSKYEFDRDTCWYKDLAEHTKDVSAKSYVYPRLIQLDHHQSVYTFPLNIRATAHIKQHRIFGKVVLTGSVYLDIAITLAQTAFGEKSLTSFRFQNVTLLKPIAFPQDEISISATIEKVAFSGDDNVYRIRMYPGDGQSTRFDDMYSSIDIQKIPKNQQHNDFVDIDDLLAGFQDCYNREEFYQRFWGTNFTIGERFQIYDQVWRVDGEKALGVCRPLDFLNETNGYGLNHENIVAYLSGLLFKGTLPEKEVKAVDSSGNTFIGTGYDACTFYESLKKERIYCYTEITYRSDDGKQFKGFAAIYDQSGKLLCHMDNIGFAEIEESSVPGLIEEKMTRDESPREPTCGHPVLGEQNSLLTNWKYNTEIDYFTYPLIDDHLTFNLAIFPAVGYIDISLKAIRKRKPDFKFTRIDKLQVATPLMLNKTDRYVVQSSVSKTPDTDYLCEIYELNNKTKGAGDWSLNATTEITDRPMVSDVDKYFDKGILKELPVQYTMKEFFDKYWSDEFILGASYHFLDNLWCNDKEVVGVMKTFSNHIKRIGITDIPGYFMQIYMSLPAAVALIPDARIEWARENDATTIAVQIGRFVVYDDNAQRNYNELWSHCILRDGNEEEDVWISDFDFYNDKGALVARVEGVEFRVMEKRALQLIESSSEQTSSASVDHCDDYKEFLKENLSRIIGVDLAKLKPGTHIGSFMDSIMALELRNEIEKNLSVLLPMHNIIDARNIEDIAEYIQEKKEK